MSLRRDPASGRSAKFELELGVRTSDFATAGRTDSANTYKALFNWAATDTLRFRGGCQRAYRVPERVGAFQRPVEQSADLVGGRALPQDTLHVWGNVAGQPERGQGSGALPRSDVSRGGRSAGPRRVRRQNPNTYPLVHDSAVARSSRPTPRQPESRARACEHADHGRRLAIERASLLCRSTITAIALEGAIDELTFQTVYQQCFNYNGAATRRTTPTICSAASFDAPT